MGDRRDKASGPRPFLTAANISNARKPLREVFRAGAVVALDTSCMYVSFLLFAARDAARA
jgi:hypothetical protein